MGRPHRINQGGLTYHVINRANARATIFEKDEDYLAFEKVLRDVMVRVPMRILSYCIMPNHWHLVLWPREDGDLSNFMRLLTLTHTQRWHAHRHTTGTGHLYQGRFKSFIVAQDDYFLSVCRYVERNALRAGLVALAEDWRWCSLWRRCNGEERRIGLLSDWPITRPQRWRERVNRPENAAELQALRQSVNRGAPLGPKAWCEDMIAQLELGSTVHPRGRPKAEKGS